MINRALSFSFHLQTCAVQRKITTTANFSSKWQIHAKAGWHTSLTVEVKLFGSFFAPFIYDRIEVVLWFCPSYPVNDCLCIFQVLSNKRMHKNYKTTSTYFSCQHIKSKSMWNLQYDCLDFLMLNFNNHLLPIQQSCTMDLSYLNRTGRVRVRL